MWVLYRESGTCESGTDCLWNEPTNEAHFEKNKDVHNSDRSEHHQHFNRDHEIMYVPQVRLDTSLA